MSAQASTSIETLRELSPKFNAAMEEASRIVYGVEKFLSEQCKLSLPLYKTYLEAQNGTVKSIGYDRLGGRFRIVLKATRVKDPTDGPSADAEPRAWCDATRAEKVESFRYVPLLLDDLAAATESHLKATTQSIEGMAQALGAVGRLPALQAQEIPAFSSPAAPEPESSKNDNLLSSDSALAERSDAGDPTFAPLELEIPELETLEDAPRRAPAARRGGEGSRG
jgi:hypothetical protein